MYIANYINKILSLHFDFFYYQYLHWFLNRGFFNTACGVINNRFLSLLENLAKFDLYHEWLLVGEKPAAGWAVRGGIESSKSFTTFRKWWIIYYFLKVVNHLLHQPSFTNKSFECQFLQLKNSIESGTQKTQVNCYDLLWAEI